MKQDAKPLTESEIDAAARGRLMHALRNIEAAEHMLSSAAEDVSALKGWARHYDAICRKREAVHDLYHRIRNALHDAKAHLTLDEMALESMRKRKDGK